MPQQGSPFSDIPNVSTLEDRFRFINSENVRQNVAVCFQYIIFLITVSTMYKRGGAIELSIYRDIVVHTASVVEASLHYGICKLIDKGKLDRNRLQSKWEYSNKNIIYKFTDDHMIVSVERKRSQLVYDDNPSAQQINNAAKVAGILDDKLWNKAEKIRKARNNIHVVGEQKEVEYPSKDEVENYFEDARLILEKIKQSTDS